MRSFLSIACALFLMTLVPAVAAAPCSTPASGVETCDFNGDGLPDRIRTGAAGVASVYVFGGQFNYWGTQYTEGYVNVNTEPGSPVGYNRVGVSATCYDVGADGNCDAKWAHVWLNLGASNQWVHVSNPPGGSSSYTYYCTSGLTGPTTCTTIVP